MLVFKLDNYFKDLISKKKFNTMFINVKHDVLCNLVINLKTNTLKNVKH